MWHVNQLESFRGTHTTSTFKRPSQSIYHWKLVLLSFWLYKANIAILTYTDNSTEKPLEVNKIKVLVKWVFASNIECVDWMDSTVINQGLQHIQGLCYMILTSRSPNSGPTTPVGSPIHSSTCGFLIPSSSHPKSTASEFIRSIKRGKSHYSDEITGITLGVKSISNITPIDVRKYWAGVTLQGLQIKFYCFKNRKDFVGSLSVNC